MISIALPVLLFVCQTLSMPRTTTTVLSDWRLKGKFTVPSTGESVSNTCVAPQFFVMVWIGIRKIVLYGHLFPGLIKIYLRLGTTMSSTLRMMRIAGYPHLSQHETDRMAASFTPELEQANKKFESCLCCKLSCPFWKCDSSVVSTSTEMYNLRQIPSGRS